MTGIDPKRSFKISGSNVSKPIAKQASTCCGLVLDSKLLRLAIAPAIVPLPSQMDA
jgi:hypothetical protein